MTAAERRGALDARLEQSYAVFDGLILSERERSEGSGTGDGSDVMSNGSGNGGGAGSETFGGEEGSIVVAAGPQYSSGAGNGPVGRNRQGEFDNSQQESYPVPEDIPSGNNDDVVARQIREAALSETDPELREALWDEYRTYTGLPQ